MAAKIEIPNFDYWLLRYQAGEPEQKLAREANVSRTLFRRHLIERGITRRGVGEANLLRMQRLTSQERLDLTAAAHSAIRGKPKSLKNRLKHALTNERRLTYLAPVELVFRDMLINKCNINKLTLQKAIGPYNVDIAIHKPPIAVEILGHSSLDVSSVSIRPRYNKRTPYLLNQGWHVLIVLVNGRRHFLTVGAVDYTIALIQELRRDKPAESQYRVIRGNGELVTTLYR